MSQKNSFISMLEQISVLNKNSVEIITKLNDVVGSKDSNITVNYLDDDGSTSQFQLPSVGFLKQEIDLANSNIKRLSSLDENESVIITDSLNSKKVKSFDLNREPEQISNIDIASEFNQGTNWFFETLMNPLISIEIDLSDKIDSSVNKVLSRRYIIQFERDPDGNLTAAGLSSKKDFDKNFLNKNNITINNFQNWMNLDTNIGVKKGDLSQYLDEQIFDINYKTIDYNGYFDVLGSENDTKNNILYYLVNRLTYINRNGNEKELVIGDILASTKKQSYTKWKIIDIVKSFSNYKLRLERIEGYDPVANGNSMLKFYSPLTPNNKIKVSIGFDEYNVIFLKPINTDTAIIGSLWSPGMAFNSNDLVLNTDNNINMTDFYINKVYDYGAVLKDLVVKQIPSKFGTKPNTPELVAENFKVVQINKHLTDTKDYKTLKKLHGQKNAIKTKINQVNDAIIHKNKELNVKQFKSVAERSKSQNELHELITKQQSDTKLYSSYVSQIINSKAEPSAEPKFRIRGFWDLPDAIIKQGFKPQEVIGFEVKWKYGSKFGTQNITEGFEMKKNISLTSLSTKASTPEKSIKKIAYFSDWNLYKTDIREREYDSESGDWYWKIEDVADADTPNINQLDIAIRKNEKVEIKIRSISEVGYPDAPLYSDWSDIITVTFPDSLSDVLGDSDFILKEATQEEVKVQFENELSAKGLNRHILDSYIENEHYVAHSDTTIATSFKDSFGNTISLFDYLTKMTSKIARLEEIIKRAKGELKVTLYRGTQETEIKNGSNLLSNIECEDYMKKNITVEIDSINVDNNVYLINDFYIKIENIAQENPLALLTSKTKLNAINNGAIIDSSIDPSFINENGNIITQLDNQSVWLLPRKNDVILYSSKICEGIPSLEEAAVLRDNINFTDAGGLSILDNSIWSSGVTGFSDPFGASVHPNISGNNDDNGTNMLVDRNSDFIHIIDPQENMIIPINIYFKPDITAGPTAKIMKDVGPKIRNKSLCFSLNTENSARAFEFVLSFKLKRHKQYSMPSAAPIISVEM